MASQLLQSLLCFAICTIVGIPQLYAEVPPAQDNSLEARIRSLEDEVEGLKQEHQESDQEHGRAVFGSDRSEYGDLTRSSQIRTTSGYQSPMSGGHSQLFEGLADPVEYPTIQWSGFVHVDTGWLSQDEANKAAIGSVDSQSGLRRVRLRVDGNVWDHAAYAIDLDFAAAGHPSFRDAKLIFHGIPILQNLQIGLFKQPFSLEAATSGRELVLMERQLPFAFDPFRQVAIGAYGTRADERVTWAASVYAFPSDSFGASVGNGAGNSLAGRVTYLPIYHDGGKQLVHVGFAYSFGDPADNTVRYSIEPGFFVSEDAGSGTSGVPVIVDTGPIFTKAFHLFNVQLAGNYGPLSVQSEASFSVVNQQVNSTASFSAIAVNCAYVLTGETRPYKRTQGVFGDIEPHRPFRLGQGGGAWEVTAGWSYIDLNDENIRGGRANQIAFGLTWYVGPNAKLMLNLVPVLVNTAGVGNSKILVTALRGQVEF